MLDDPHPDARFNAATGLARRGDAAALPVLIDMLGSDQTLATEEEKPENRQEKQALVNLNGLRALAQLADTNATVDLHGAEAAVQKLTESKIPELRKSALSVREKLSRRNAATQQVNNFQIQTRRSIDGSIQSEGD